MIIFVVIAIVVLLLLLRKDSDYQPRHVRREKRYDEYRKDIGYEPPVRLL